MSVSSQLKVSLLKYLQVLSGCKQTSRSSISSGTQTVRKSLEIYGHRPWKALILALIIIIIFLVWEGWLSISLKIPVGLCVLQIPIPGAVSLPRRDTQFSRMRSKTNILSPGVTPVGGEHSLVAPRSGSVPKLVVTFELLWPEAFWCAEFCSLKLAGRHCSPESPGFRTQTPLWRRGPDLSVQKGLSPC